MFHDEPARHALILVCARTLLVDQNTSYIWFHPASTNDEQTKKSCRETTHTQCGPSLMAQSMPEKGCLTPCKSYPA